MTFELQIDFQNKFVSFKTKRFFKILNGLKIGCILFSQYTLTTMNRTKCLKNNVCNG